MTLLGHNQHNPEGYERRGQQEEQKFLDWKKSGNEQIQRFFRINRPSAEGYGYGIGSA